MLRKWIMVILSFTLLTNTFERDENQNPHLTRQLIDKNSVVLNNEFCNNPKLKLLEKDYERVKLEKEQNKKHQKEVKQKKGIPVRLLVTYYGATKSQCGNSDGIMANQEKAHYGAIAVPQSIPIGSKIIMDKSGRKFIAKDRGNPKYICELGNNYYRVDIFIPRLESEINNDIAYEKRVRAMGTDDVTAMLIINN